MVSNQTAIDRDDAVNVIDLRPRPTLQAPHDLAAPTAWHAVAARHIAPEDWRRVEEYVSEILTAMGMDLDTPGTGETPHRFLKALYDSTAGYEV